MLLWGRMLFESIYRCMQISESNSSVQFFLILTINPILLTPKDWKMLSKEPMGFLIMCLNFSSVSSSFFFFFKVTSALDFSTLAFVVLKKKKKFLNHSRRVTYFAWRWWDWVLLTVIRLIRSACLMLLLPVISLAQISLDFNYNFNGEHVFFIKISNSKVH